MGCWRKSRSPDHTGSELQVGATSSCRRGKSDSRSRRCLFKPMSRKRIHPRHGCRTRLHRTGCADFRSLAAFTDFACLFVFRIYRCRTDSVARSENRYMASAESICSDHSLRCNTARFDFLCAPYLRTKGDQPKFKYLIISAGRDRGSILNFAQLRKMQV